MAGVSGQVAKILKRLPIDTAAQRVIDVQGPYIPQQVLQALLNHECGALVVRNFYGQVERDSLLRDIDQALRQKQGLSNWKVSQSDGKLVDSDVETLGMPLNVAKGTGRVEEYFATALDSIRKFRINGRMTPLDKLRLELDECFPSGCVLGRDGTTKKPHAGGLLRIMRRSSNRGLVHMDDAAELSSEKGVFSANIYLQTSMAGGEIEIWPVGFKSKDEAMNHALEIGLLTSASADVEAQRALREFVLPNPPIVIAPKPGDLIMLCVQRPHSVKGPLHGSRPRISAQTFILHDGPNVPLKIEV